MTQKEKLEAELNAAARAKRAVQLRHKDEIKQARDRRGKELAEANKAVNSAARRLAAIDKAEAVQRAMEAAENSEPHDEPSDEA